MEMMDKKYITPEQGLRYLNMSETGRMYEELQVSTRQAERENLRMSQGEEVQTNTYDEDPIHVLAHDMYRRRQAFDRLPDPVKIIFENHVQQHKQKMGLQQGTPIAPGEPLPPSPDGSASSASTDGGGGPPGMSPMPPQAGAPQGGDTGPIQE